MTSAITVTEWLKTISMAIANIKSLKKLFYALPLIITKMTIWGDSWKKTYSYYFLKVRDKDHCCDCKGFQNESGPHWTDYQMEIKENEITL